MMCYVVESAGLVRGKGVPNATSSLQGTAGRVLARRSVQYNARKKYKY